MIPGADREELLEALALFDEEEREDDKWLTNRAHRYAIRHEGRLYPVKRIVSISTGAPVSSFSGGKEANDFVRARELEIVEIGEQAMSLREKLAEILSTYASDDRGPFGKDNPVYSAFSEAADALDQLAPVEERDQLRVKPSAGQGNWANVPWIALMDKRETTSTQHGVYVVYLFCEDMSGLYLTFNQGVTQLFNDHGAARARELLHENAEEVRALASDLPEHGFLLDNERIDLMTSSTLGRRYEESTIAHKFYPADDLPSDEQLESDLDAVLQAYDSYLDQEQETERGATASRAAEDQDDAERLQATLDWIRGKGYYFEPWQLASFVAAAKTKPFVILAGVSGTGKSKLPQLLAAATGARSTTVPVRPDWTDSADLLGYRDLHGRFRAGELTEFCRNAQAEPDRPAFFVIDEMNLARVEYYFAEVLSRIEDDPRLGQSGALISGDLHPEDAHWAEVKLPPNLLLVGTVNMDETTHGFSKKVLDRAFTLEFSRVELAEWESPAVTVGSAPSWTYEDWQPRARRLSELSDVTQRDRTLIHSTIEALEEVNEILQPAQMQVGYRVRDELALFRLHSVAYTDMFVDAEGASVDPIDVGLTMKLLPRISGGSNIVRRLIRQLLGWSWHGEVDLDDSKVDSAVDDWESAGAGDLLPGATYPRTAGRLCLMWQRLQSEGFTSYWL